MKSLNRKKKHQCKIVHTIIKFIGDFFFESKEKNLEVGLKDREPTCVTSTLASRYFTFMYIVEVSLQIKMDNLEIMGQKIQTKAKMTQLQQRKSFSTLN